MPYNIEDLSYTVGSVQWNYHHLLTIDLLAYKLRYIARQRLGQIRTKIDYYYQQALDK